MSKKQWTGSSNEMRMEILREEIREGIPCEICGESAQVADHCHKTKRSRGPLCIACNSMIGFARDDIEMLKAGIEYLEEYKCIFAEEDNDVPAYQGSPFDL